MVTTSEPFALDPEAGWTSVSGIVVSDPEESELVDSNFDDDFEDEDDDDDYGSAVEVESAGELMETD